MLPKSPETLINTTAAQPVVTDPGGKKIINGISIILPILAAAHENYSLDADSDLSIGESVSALMAHCKSLIDGVKEEAKSRGIEIGPRDEALVNAACLNAVLVSAADVIGGGASEDLTGTILNVLTSLEVAKTRGVITGENEGMPLTMAAAMESAAAVAIFVSASTHHEYENNEGCVEKILMYIEGARVDAGAILRIARLGSSSDIDKVSAVITREITRVFLAVMAHQQRVRGDDFSLNDALARGCFLTEAFLRGIERTSASISGDI